MNPMITHDLIHKYTKTCTMNNCVCCAHSKITKTTFKSVVKFPSLLELMHTDIGDNKEHLTRGGIHYFITCIDKFSKFTLCTCL